jgi:hypothetical protein
LKNILYGSIAEMTDPKILSVLVNKPITKTRLVPYQTIGWSSTDSQFLAVETDDAEHPQYIVKRMLREQDWVMQMTEDQHWRAVAIWQHGLLDSLPEEIDHTIIACAVDENGYALLMRNIAHTLLDNISLSETDNEINLNAMAALHATFWNDKALNNSILNLCSPENLFTHTAPERIQQITTNNPAPVLNMILEGWRLLPKFIDADVVDLLRGLAHDPNPLCTALLNYPQTLVHGDWCFVNLGVERGESPRLVLLDWARPTLTAPAIDLAYYLVTSWRKLPVSKQATIDLYKQHLVRRIGKRFDETWWQPQLELSLLAALLMIGCIKAWSSIYADDEKQRIQEQADLEWWAEQARPGAKWLGV